MRVFYLKRSGTPTVAKLLVTVSGGTVSSSVKDGLVKLEKESPIASYLKGKAEETLFISPANYSSENARPEDYRDVLKAVSEAASAIRPDGILILHGTDTMAYFAQLAARALSHMSIPFVITGSKIPPDCEGTDAFSNIDFAVERSLQETAESYLQRMKEALPSFPQERSLRPTSTAITGSGLTVQMSIILPKDTKRPPRLSLPPESFTGYRSLRPRRRPASLTKDSIRCS